MAIVHRADLKPTKLELLAAWLPTQPWFDGDADIDREAAFRLDDPVGEVGIETFIVRSGPALVHVPLTYRAAPLPSGTLVGEMEHSVLGHRWVYDGPTDPVYVAVTIAAIQDGAHEVEMEFEDGTVLPRQEWSASVSGSGPVGAGATGRLGIARSLPATAPAGAPTLQATWAAHPDPLVLAWLTD